VTTARILAGEQASWRVYILPTVLLIVLVGLALLVGALVRRGRRVGRGLIPGQPACFSSSGFDLDFDFGGEERRGGVGGV
jgi:hypothetical protein